MSFFFFPFLPFFLLNLAKAKDTVIEVTIRAFSSRVASLKSAKDAFTEFNNCFASSTGSAISPSPIDIGEIASTASPKLLIDVTSSIRDCIATA